MKLRKILFLIILVVSFGTFYSVDAITKEEAEEFLEDVVLKEVEMKDDDSCTYHANSIEFNKLVKNIPQFSKTYTKEEFLVKHPYLNNVSEELQNAAYEEYLLQGPSYVATAVFNASIKNYSALGGYYVGATLKNDNITFSVLYDDGTGGLLAVNKTCKITYKTVSDSILEDVDNTLTELENEYSLSGFKSLNSIYHYGGAFSNLDKLNVLLYRFPEIKDFMIENDQYEYKSVWDGSGSSPISEGSASSILLYKDDVVVGLKNVNVDFSHIFFVDKNESGTVYERALKRIKEHFGEKVNVELSPEKDFDNPTENLVITDSDNEINRVLGTKDVKYTGYMAEVTIGSNDTRLMIIEVDTEDVDKYEVSSFDKKTDVNVYTNSFDVPIDATLEVFDAKNSNDVQHALKDKNFKLVDAYDISLVKTGNGTFINTIENGIEVFIPIKDRKVGTKMTIGHVKDGEIGDVYEGEVVEIKGKTYVKFVTDHFSTYAVLENDNVDVPNTYDVFYKNLSLFIISVLTLSTSVILFKRYN